MEPLLIDSQVISRVRYADLERFAQEAYKLKKYRFAEVEECGNDTDHAFTVDGVLDEDDDEDDIAAIRAGGPVPMWRNGLLLDMLCADGLILPGHYLIQVSW